MGLQMCWGSLRVCEVAKVECLDNMMNRRDPTLVIVPHRRMNNPPLQVNNLQGMLSQSVSYFTVPSRAHPSAGSPSGSAPWNAGALNY